MEGFTDEEDFDWAGLAGSAGTGHIGTVLFDEKMKSAKKEDVKAIWEIAEKFLGIRGFWGIEIGGGRREDPKTTWEEACEELKNIFSD